MAFGMGFIIRRFRHSGPAAWLIVWVSTPALGPAGAFFATFSSDPLVLEAIEQSAPVLLSGGGTFLIFLFLHWLFLEKKISGSGESAILHPKGSGASQLFPFFLPQLSGLPSRGTR